MQKFCVRCKGRLECGARFCPIEQKSKAYFKVKDNLKEDFFGSSPNIFVGHFGYPDVNVGILSPQEVSSEQAQVYDAPVRWARDAFSIDRIIGLRSALVNSRFRTEAKVGLHGQNRFIGMGQEIAMAGKPVDVEINLAKRPTSIARFDAITAPMGPSAGLKSARLTENPSIPKAVDKTVSDTDLKATDAMKELTRRDFDEYFLTKLLSAGNLGVKPERKLVPTRWAITAVDDNVGKQLIDEIRDFRHSEYEAYFGGHMGNHYIILLFPDVFRYELFETSLSGSVYNLGGEPAYVTDYESHHGRKEYAYDTAGGYYAARLPILQKLHSRKRQASVLALRFITNEYFCPLGVWVVREAVKKALSGKPIIFEEKRYMLDYAVALIRKKFRYDPSPLLKESRLLEEVNNQQKLTHFLGRLTSSS